MTEDIVLNSMRKQIKFLVDVVAHQNTEILLIKHQLEIFDNKNPLTQLIDYLKGRVSDMDAFKHIAGNQTRMEESQLILKIAEELNK